MEVRDWDDNILYRRQAENIKRLMQEAMQELEKPEVAEIRIRKLREATKGFGKGMDPHSR